MKTTELLWGALIVLFIGWVLLAPTPQVRIERICRPLHWAGSGVVSLTAMTAPSYEKDSQDASNKVLYACEYSVWRLFYQSAYDKYLAEHRQIQAANSISCAKDSTITKGHHQTGCSKTVIPASASSADSPPTKIGASK